MRIVLLLIFIVSSHTAFSQFKVRLGLGLDFIPLKIKGPVDTTSIQNGAGAPPRPIYAEVKKTWGVNLIGAHLLLEYNLPLSKESSVTLSAGSKIIIQNSQNDFFNNQIAFDYPVHLMYRYGLFASPKSDHDFGFAIGAGYAYHRITIPYGTINIVGEITFSEYYAVRLNFDPMPYNLHAIYTSEGIVKVGSLQVFGASFIVGLDGLRNSRMY